MGKSKSLILFLFLFSAFTAKAQLHFIYLNDKNGSEYTLENPEEFLTEKSIQRRINQGIDLSIKDLPVSKNYKDQITAKGGKIIYASKWLNGLLIEANEETYAEVMTLPFVTNDKGMTFLRKGKKTGLRGTKNIKLNKKYEEYYGVSLDQNKMLGIDAMHKDGYHGEGLTIAVLDAGFYKANELPVFDTLFNKGKILATYDFVNNEEEVFEDDDHGMQVLSSIGGYADSALIGGAYKSNYILLKTEDIYKETRLEEIYWLLGAEFADSLGADILTSSLGYNTFDNPNDNYSKEDLDGNTSITTIAADYAASVGMLVIVSAGNEGNDDWGTLTFPADGDSVLSVGAVNNMGEYANFSSRGNTYDDRMKPDVVALGVGTVVASRGGGITRNNGTSFSSPIITGLAAGLWQAFPELTNMELLELIRRSGTNAQDPDSLIGYGIPNYTKAKQLQINGIEDMIKGETIVYPNPLEDTFLIIRDSNFMEAEKVKITLYSTDCRLLKQTTVKVNKKEITLTQNFIGSISPGTYLLRIDSEKEKTFRKLIKQ